MTLFIKLVLCCPITHSNEHRLHIFSIGRFKRNGVILCVERGGGEGFGADPHLLCEHVVYCK